MYMNQQSDALHVIFTRRSVRFYTEQPVSDQDMQTIVRAGMFAPSAHNGRNWVIITITDQEMRNKLAGLCKYWRSMREAPLVIACCTSPDQAVGGLFMEQNGSAATQNMLLAIHALGLGGVWLNCAPTRDFYQPAKALLGIPADVRLVSFIACGYPAPDLPPRAAPEDRFEPEKWKRETW